LKWWRGVWITNDAKRDRERHERKVSRFSRPFVVFVFQNPPDKELHQRQIEATDRQIDALVYELYGVTEEEIGIVEGRLDHE